LIKLFLDKSVMALYSLSLNWFRFRVCSQIVLGWFAPSYLSVPNYLSGVSNILFLSELKTNGLCAAAVIMFRTLSIEPTRIEDRSKEEVRANLVVFAVTCALIRIIPIILRKIA